MASSTTAAPSDPKRAIRKEKEYLGEIDSQMKDIRLQLNEQLRCLDTRIETQVSIVSELQDFFRRRAEVELDYSKNMDKLTKSLLWRQKEQKQRREQWHLFSAHSCWQHLVAQSKKKARDHAVISDIYANVITQRLNQVQEDAQRIYRRCREVGAATHEQLLKVIHELYTALKTSQVYQGECRQAEAKLRYVESQRSKLEASIPKEKLEKSKKFKLIEKEISKRKNKYNETYLKAMKARNEYLLALDAANASVHKYFVDDISDLIDCMDFGFHTCISRALLLHVSVEENMRKSLQTSIDGMQKCLGNLDSRADKQRFLEGNHTAFMIPKKFETVSLQLKSDDATHELSMHEQLRSELASRHGQLQNLLTGLRTESEEVWKTLETAEKSLLEMITAKDFDTSPAFADEDNRSIASLQPKHPESSLKLRANRHETEDFYLTKFGEYISISNRTHRLQARQDLIEKTICEPGFQLATSPKPSTGGGAGLPGSQNALHKPRRRRIGRTPLMGQPKLFGGSLEEYLEATNVEIPLVVKSCIRVINLYGLHHQGIFRVSGSQLEINNFKEAFERGEDPLADVTDASDINSVAGVLKLYLRELREPFFPIVFFDQFMEIAQLNSKEEFTARIREVFQTLPRPVFVVMRYIFSFLNHLSEYSDENMMDPYNLAICFGPTLVPVPEDKDQVQYQNLVNELIKNIIIMSDDIFPSDGGAMYEKYLTREPDDGEMGEAPSEPIQDDADSEICPSEDDSVFREKDISLQLFGKAEALEAIAQFDFTARSARELSFKKGETLTLFSQVSGDWWRGAKDGCEGLIPDKYIMLRIRDEDRERSEPSRSVTSMGDGGRPRVPSADSGVPSSPLVSAGTPLAPSDNVFRTESSDRVALVRPTKLSNPLSVSNDNLGESNDSLLQSTPEPIIPETKTSITEAQNVRDEDELEQSISLATGSISNMSLSSSDLTLADRDERNSLAESLSLSEDVSRCNSFSSLSSMVQSEKDADFGRNSSLGSSESLRDLSTSIHSETNVADEPRHHRRVKSGVTEGGLSMGVGLKLEDWGSRSMCEQKVAGNTKGSFTRKRDLWEKRSNTSDSSDDSNVQRSSRQWNATRSESQPQSMHSFVPQLPLQLRQKHTPDLVMDLPVSALPSASGDGVRLRASSTSSLSSSPAMDSVFDSAVEPESSNPGSPQMTAAETFAMQSQNTLKKSSTSKSLPRSDSPERKSVDLTPRTSIKDDGKSVAGTSRLTVVGRHFDLPETRTSAVELKSFSSSSFSSFGAKAAASDNPTAITSTPRPHTPKLVAKFPNLYCTPTPVLPIATAGGVPVFELPNADPNAQAKPQVKVKPQVLKKPTLPQMPSPEPHRRNNSQT